MRRAGSCRGQGTGEAWPGVISRNWGAQHIPVGIFLAIWEVQGASRSISVSIPLSGGLGGKIQEVRKTPRGHIHQSHGLGARNGTLKTICPIKFHAMV